MIIGQSLIGEDTYFSPWYRSPERLQRPLTLDEAMALHFKTRRSDTKTWRAWDREAAPTPRRHDIPRRRTHRTRYL